MRFNKTLFVAYILIFCSAASALAQGADAPVKQVQSSNNMLANLLIVISVVFALIIFGMGQVLLGLIRQILNNKKAAQTVATVFLIAGFLFTGQSAVAQAPAGEVVNVVPNYGGLDATAFWMLVTVIGIEVVAILFLLFFIRRIQAELVPATTKARKSSFAAWWSRVDKKLLTSAVPVEKEADVLLDHDYDGIRELDNALPPWWKWGFIITCFFAGVYLLNFHVFGSGKNPTQEYEAELKAAAVKLEAYNAKNKDKVDESNIVMADAAGLAEGKDIFTTTCWACHGKLGEGGAGPNLTDDYWIHKGSLNDIYQSIKVGYTDKGMQSWQKQYSPKQMSYLASYIKTLKGTNPPNGKAAQGELFTDAPAVADSAVVAISTDTTKAK